jgi:hypothetical protein
MGSQPYPQYRLSQTIPTLFTINWGRMEKTDTKVR